MLAAAMIFSQTMPIMADVSVSGNSVSADSVPEDSVSTEPASENGYAPSGNVIHDVPHEETSDGLLNAASFPSSYDLRDEGAVTAVRNQNPHGTCWTYATVASAESNILKNGYETSPDLSEYQHGYYTIWRNAQTQPEGCKGDISGPSSGHTFTTAGGDCFTSLLSLMERRGFVRDSEAPKTIHADSPNYDDSVLAYNDNSYVLSNADLAYGSNTNAIKDLIMNKGAVSISVAFLNGDKDAQGIVRHYYQEDNDALYDPNPDETNHSVTAVGWDDSYSRENFSEEARPSHDGAWIVRNSYGNYGNHGGYFYLSYEDAVFAQNMITSFQVIPASEASDHIYQYDGAFSSDAMKEPAGSAMANVFTANGDETLRAVQVYTWASMTKYKVTVCHDVTDAPSSGTIDADSSTEGCIRYAGCHTIDLSAPVSLKAGEKFSVAIQILEEDGSADGTVGLCHETLHNAGNPDDQTLCVVSSFTSEKGESYYTTDGNVWMDQTDGNFNLKALTDDNITEITLQGDGDTSVGDSSSLHFLASGEKKTVWSCSGNLPDGLSLNTQTGMLLGTYEKCGKYTFTIHAANGSGSAEKTVTIDVGSKRLGDETRYLTSLEIAHAADYSKPDSIIIVSGENWPDILAAGALSGTLGCPFLLNGNDPDNCIEYLYEECYPSLNTCYIVGGPDAIEPELDKTLQKYGKKVVRFDGADRTETADRIASEVMKTSSSDTCFICSGKDYADALSIASYTAAAKTPVLLTKEDGTLSDETISISKGFRNIWIIGGTEAVSSRVEEQLKGIHTERISVDDRYATNHAVIDQLFGNMLPAIGIASGMSWPDAAVSAEFLGRQGGALLLADGGENTLTEEEKAEIRKTDKVYIFGGESVVSAALQSSVDEIFERPQADNN